MVLRLCARAAGRPVDCIALLAAAGMSLVIVVNAVFLQSGSLPAPFFVNPKPVQAAANDTPKPAEPSPPVRQIIAPVAPQPVVARRNDPIATLISQSPRIAAVQRALSEYGYAQLSRPAFSTMPPAKRSRNSNANTNCPLPGG